MSRKTFIKGAFILTLAGVLTRILGFFFRIYLSRIIGAEGVGLYQLVMPVCTVSYAVGISGFEVAVSRLTAVYTSEGRHSKAYKSTFLCGFFSLITCILCCVLVRANAHNIGKYFFHNADCAPLIRIVMLSVPFSCIHCMVSGYYMGQEKTAFPAFSQLAEQIVRISSVYFIIKITGKTDASTGVLSLVIGEAGAALISFTAIILSGKKSYPFKPDKNSLQNSVKEIFHTALPVSGNRTALYGLQSVEAALIPVMLIKNGLTETEALSVFGVVTGMAMPIILFPATLSNSVALMLLPSVSKIKNNPAKLKESGFTSLWFSLIFGFVCIVFFETLGAPLGAFCFKNNQVCTYIRILAWLCPFMFISTTYKSILNALGKSTSVLANSMLSESICLILIIVLVPKLGIRSYLIGLLLNQASNALLHMRSFFACLRKINQSDVPSN